jgi:ABC-2 type transport system ATP-binding protein
MMISTHAIEANGLRKVFGDNVAVKNLTLQVKQGEIFGFLGPNGAGKTTSIKMLLNLIAPTAGSANLLGLPLGNRQTRKKIGFLPEHFRFHEWLTAAEFLTLHGDLYGIPKQTLISRVADLLELVGLTPFREKQLRTFSKGMLQRIGLAQTLLNEPDLVFLDEPTSGLDPVGRRLVRDIMCDLRKKGATVFLNSHLLSEVEITCDRVAFIKHGEVIQVVELNNHRDLHSSVTIRTAGVNEQTLAGLQRWVQNVRLDGNDLTFSYNDEIVLPEVNRYLVSQGVDVYAIRPQHLSLEDLFIQIVGTDGGL